MQQVTKTLAECINNTTINDIPSDVIEHAKIMIIDTIGVTLVGADTDTAKKANNRLGWSTDDAVDSSAHVFGTGETASPAHASFLNGIAAHALDFDDVHKTMGGHPSASVLPPVLSVAEVINADGADVIRSFVLGVECELLLADVLNPSHYDRGWHPTAIFGHIGAGVAVASLFNLDTDGIRRTIGIATSQASGVKGNFGTMTKPYHVGKAARSGIEAAQLARSGFTANKNILELDFGGFCDLFKGEDGYRFDDHLANFGDEWRLISPPVNFKSYPCCGSTHIPIDIALEMRDEYPIEYNDINRVEITEHPRRLAHTNIPHPESDLEAKFSVQYAVATALRKGDIWIDDFTIDSVTDTSTQQFLKSVEVNADETLGDDRDRYARIDIEAKGKTYSQEMDDRRLRGKDEVLDKFHRCVRFSSVEADAETVISKLDGLESVTDIRSIISDLTLNDK